MLLTSLSRAGCDKRSMHETRPRQHQADSHSPLCVAEPTTASPACASTSRPPVGCAAANSGHQGRGCLLVVGGGAELDDLERLLDDRNVTWREVVNLAGAEDFLVVGVLDAQPAFDDVASVRARATAVRQLGGEELGGVMDSDVGDGDAEVAPLRLPTGENAGYLHPAGQVVLGGVHGSSLRVSMPVARLFRFYWTGVS